MNTSTPALDAEYRGIQPQDTRWIQTSVVIKQTADNGSVYLCIGDSDIHLPNAILASPHETMVYCARRALVAIGWPGTPQFRFQGYNDEIPNVLQMVFLVEVESQFAPPLRILRRGSRWLSMSEIVEVEDRFRPISFSALRVANVVR